ncbi:hypothetical protein AG1IA_08174 [Rhizoctonia solani AG-1 IA]|uniref:Uncharacterized protein n=1 Tax=Thanatephorus cucumeris (strain AG1-IA) TaxID=983506 RepID=L8WHZ6_THACA|nr:hypothetical protein AG1IA_08174 [Rhizoctonia solani AG-1 IA]
MARGTGIAGKARRPVPVGNSNKRAICSLSYLRCGTKATNKTYGIIQPLYHGVLLTRVIEQSYSAQRRHWIPWALGRLITRQSANEHEENRALRCAWVVRRLCGMAVLNVFYRRETGASVTFHAPITRLICSLDWGVPYVRIQYIPNWEMCKGLESPRVCKLTVRSG